MLNLIQEHFRGYRWFIFSGIGLLVSGLTLPFIAMNMGLDCFRQCSGLHLLFTLETLEISKCHKEINKALLLG